MLVIGKLFLLITFSIGLGNDQWTIREFCTSNLIRVSKNDTGAADILKVIKPFMPLEAQKRIDSVIWRTTDIYYVISTLTINDTMTTSGVSIGKDDTYEVKLETEIIMVPKSSYSTKTTEVEADEGVARQINKIILKTWEEQTKIHRLTLFNDAYHHTIEMRAAEGDYDGRCDWNLFYGPYTKEELIKDRELTLTNDGLLSPELVDLQANAKKRLTTEILEKVNEQEQEEE